MNLYAFPRPVPPSAAGIVSELRLSTCPPCVQPINEPGGFFVNFALEVGDLLHSCAYPSRLEGLGHAWQPTHTTLEASDVHFILDPEDDLFWADLDGSPVVHGARFCGIHYSDRLCAGADERPTVFCHPDGPEIFEPLPPPPPQVSETLADDVL